jgi:hypothetical protein
MPTCPHVSCTLQLHILVDYACHIPPRDPMSYVEATLNLHPYMLSYFCGFFIGLYCIFFSLHQCFNISFSACFDAFRTSFHAYLGTFKTSFTTLTICLSLSLAALYASFLARWAYFLSANAVLFCTRWAFFSVTLSSSLNLLAPITSLLDGLTPQLLQCKRLR